MTPGQYATRLARRSTLAAGVKNLCGFCQGTVIRRQEEYLMQVV